MYEVRTYYMDGSLTFVAIGLGLLLLAVVHTYFLRDVLRDVIVYGTLLGPTTYWQHVILRRAECCTTTSSSTVQHTISVIDFFVHVVKLKRYYSIRNKFLDVFETFWDLLGGTLND